MFTQRKPVKPNKLGDPNKSNQSHNPNELHDRIKAQQAPCSGASNQHGTPNTLNPNEPNNPNDGKEVKQQKSSQVSTNKPNSNNHIKPNKPEAMAARNRVTDAKHKQSAASVQLQRGLEKCITRRFMASTPGRSASSEAPYRTYPT